MIPTTPELRLMEGISSVQSAKVQIVNTTMKPYNTLKPKPHIELDLCTRSNRLNQQQEKYQLSRQQTRNIDVWTAVGFLNKKGGRLVVFSYTLGAYKNISR